MIHENEIIVYIEKHLSPKRYIHTMGVVEVGQTLASVYEADIEKVRIACLLHDVGRRYSLDELKNFLKEREHNLPEEYYSTKGLLHASVGYYIAREEFGIADEEILSAILHHTTGGANLGLVEKIVYIADYLDPNRKLPNTKNILSLALKDLDKALFRVVLDSIEFILAKRSRMALDTIAFYNELLRDMK